MSETANHRDREPAKQKLARAPGIHDDYLALRRDTGVHLAVAMRATRGGMIRLDHRPSVSPQSAPTAVCRIIFSQSARTERAFLNDLTVEVTP